MEQLDVDSQYPAPVPVVLTKTEPLLLLNCPAGHAEQAPVAVTNRPRGQSATTPASKNGSNPSISAGLRGTPIPEGLGADEV